MIQKPVPQPRSDSKDILQHRDQYHSRWPRDTTHSVRGTSANWQSEELGRQIGTCLRVYVRREPVAIELPMTPVVCRSYDKA